MRVNAKMIAKALEVLVEMQDADGRVLGSRSYGQIG